MKFGTDTRIPVIFGSASQACAEDALLREGLPEPGAATFQPEPGQMAACTCCGPRRAAGHALAALVQARGRGKVAFFRRVVAVTATEAGRRDVEAALQGDPVASACYRLITSECPKG